MTTEATDRRSRRALTALALAALLIACHPGASWGAFRNVAAGGAFPAFSLPDLSGGAHDLAGLAGKPAVIGFVSGNDRSKKVMEDLQVLASKLGGEGLAVLAIYTGSDEAEAKGMVEAAKASFPMLLDKDKKLYGEVGVAVTPVLAFVDKEGKLIKDQPYVPLLAGILEVEAKVALGKMTREEADLSLKPEETPEVSAEEKEADKLYNLGLVLLERGMKDKAVEKFKQVLTVDSTYCKVRLQLGHLYLEDGKTDEAKTEFEYVLKCDPMSHEAKVGMGTVYGVQGDFDKAIELLESSLSLNPKAELAHYELGKVYEKKGQLDKAVENYKKALDRLLSK